MAVVCFYEFITALCYFHYSKLAALFSNLEGITVRPRPWKYKSNGRTIITTAFALINNPNSLRWH